MVKVTAAPGLAAGFAGTPDHATALDAVILNAAGIFCSDTYL